MNIVWFKRDLRVQDHEPLHRAAQQGEVLPIYIVEPQLWQQQDASLRQWLFVRDSLVELDMALKKIGQGLTILQGEAVDVLNVLIEKFSI